MKMEMREINLYAEREVSLQMMLQCREARAKQQRELIKKYGKPVVSFTMNIAGPIKRNYFIERGFFIGYKSLEGAFYSYKAKVLYSTSRISVTGPEGYYVVDLDSQTLKKICMEIEDQDELGRLFDIDVIDPNGTKLERKEERRCLICDKPAKECSSRRLHTVQELWDKTSSILQEAVLQYDAETVAALAVKALLYEVLTTPKPGLVDRNNNGSHQDMDLFTFSGSASVLFPYFQKAYTLGFNAMDPKACFSELRELGKRAERTMFLETHGINTHKGAIFTLGIVCAAAGFTAITHTDIFQCCADMTAGITEELKDDSLPETNGKRLFKKYGVTGIRGELEDGLPSVREVGLPTLERHLHNGKSLEYAGSRALVALIAQGNDTNLLARGGVVYAELAQAEADHLLDWAFRQKDLEKLDNWFIENNLSPGGCADLLAVCYFLHFLRKAYYV